MAIACCVCTAVYLALSSGLSLISRDWGIPTSSTAPPAAAPWGAWAQKKKKKKKKTGGVEGGEWGGTQTGSGCNFLWKLSEPFLVWPIRWNEGERKREQGRKMERKRVRVRKGDKKKKKKRRTKTHQRNLLCHSAASSHGNQKRKLLHSMNETKWWTNEEQRAHEKQVRTGEGDLKLHGLHAQTANASILRGFLDTAQRSLRQIHHEK